MEFVRCCSFVLAIVLASGPACGGRSLSAGTETSSGEDSESGSEVVPDLPPEIPPPGFAVDVEASGLHVCAVGDGRLRCWGGDYEGELGRPDLVELPPPFSCDCVGGSAAYGAKCCLGDDEVPAVLGDIDVGAKVLKVAPTYKRTCALLEGGLLKCWGYDFAGVLGYGDDPTLPWGAGPAEFPPLAIDGVVVDVDVNTFQTCVVLDDGSVRCWGHDYDHYGGLGHPGVALIEKPMDAAPVDVGGPVKSLATGAHTCALLEDGRVRCWGFNMRGALGYGHTDHIGWDQPPSAAGDVPVGAPVVALAVGGQKTCAITQARTLRCWGSGPLGYARFPEDRCFDCHTDPGCCVGDDETPAEVGDLDVGGLVEQVAVGDWHICAVLEGGSLRCWGEARDGKLGQPPIPDCGPDHAWDCEDAPGCCIGDHETPASQPVVDIGRPVVDLDLSSWYTCAATDDGHLRCWGYGSLGQLGRGDMTGDCTPDVHTQLCVWGDDPGETPAAAGPIELW